MGALAIDAPAVFLGRPRPSTVARIWDLARRGAGVRPGLLHLHRHCWCRRLTRNTSAQFHKWAGSESSTRRRSSGVAEANIAYLGEKPELDTARMKRRSTRENVVKAFADLAARAKANDEVFVLLIGHGSFDGKTAAFNLPGPDLTADDYKPLLEKLRLQRVVFVNTASSSGAFLSVLAGPARTIVTATKTGGERNETAVRRIFRRGAAGDGADRDRNGRVSVLEAFDYAKTKVVAAYEQGGNLLTEHATLDDGAEGKLAATLFLAPQRSRTAEMAERGSGAARARRAARRARTADRRAEAEERWHGAGALRRAAREAVDGAGAEDAGDPGPRGQEMKWALGVLVLVASASAMAGAQGRRFGSGSR